MTHQPAPLSVAEALRAARDTRAIELGPGVIYRTPVVFRELFGDRPAVLVADRNTFTAAGRAVASAFAASGHPMLEHVIFEDAHLHAEQRHVTALEAALRKHTAVPIGVGSGTINDLTKLAAYRTGRPYVCVATAASMDGYTAFGASITSEGLKQTFMCPAPTAVIADLDVISSAPAPMNSWGYADLVAKFTAGADWLVADALGVEPIEPQAWMIAQGRLREITADPRGIRRCEQAALKLLVEGLLLSGFAMQSVKSSRPASGAEHHFSHLWDMQGHVHNGQTPSHGFKVGIGALGATALYEELFKLQLDQLVVDECCAVWPDVETWIARAQRWFTNPQLLAHAERELRTKHVSREQLRAQLEELRAVWHELRKRVRAQLLPFDTLKQRLQDAGAPTEPEQIGITRARLRQSYWEAFCIRRRFTVLDLAVRANLLDKCLARIFGSGGYWPIEHGTSSFAAT